MVSRVAWARVVVSDQVTGEIGPGLLVLVGAGREDGPDQAAWLADKLAGLRVFEDDAGVPNRDVVEAGGGVLVVSQFTLYGDTQKGRRPSFIDAARPEQAIPLYQRFVAELEGKGLRVATGEFGADMQVELVNDGPVTLVLERSG